MNSPKYNYTFQRYEKKYLLTEEKRQMLLERLNSRIQVDGYGLTTICNLYYDTDENLLIRRSIEKPVYKEKLRLRSYGIPSNNDTVFLEIKKKYKGIVYKRRVDLTLQEAYFYLNNGIRPMEDNQRFRELDYFNEFYKPFPKQYLAYDRTAYTCVWDPNIRITIDQNIRSRTEDLRLEDGDAGKLLLPKGSSIMEIKVTQNVPLWLVRILSELKIYPSSFSKYGKIYEKNRHVPQLDKPVAERKIAACSTAS